MDVNNYGDLQGYYIERFELDVPMPNVCALIFYPDNYNFRANRLGEYNPDPEVIVEQALSFKSIQ